MKDGHQIPLFLCNGKLHLVDLPRVSKGNRPNNDTCEAGTELFAATISGALYIAIIKL